MKKIGKSALKAKMLEYFREVEETGEPLIVTDGGRPVLQVVPYKSKGRCSDIFSDLRGKASIDRAAAVSPTEEEWE